MINDLLQRDLGSSLLSLAIIIGLIGVSVVFLRVFTLLIKRILEAVFKES